MQLICFIMATYILHKIKQILHKIKQNTIAKIIDISVFVSGTRFFFQIAQQPSYRLIKTAIDEDCMNMAPAWSRFMRL
jgi:hypothetical protein